MSAPSRPQRTDQLLVALADAGFEFVVVGGVAAIAHGATRSTKDLAVVAPMSAEHGYDDLETVELQLIARRSFRVLAVDPLIETKRHAGRPHDREVANELRLLKAARGARGGTTP